MDVEKENDEVMYLDLFTFITMIPLDHKGRSFPPYSRMYEA